MWSTGNGMVTLCLTFHVCLITVSSKLRKNPLILWMLLPWGRSLPLLFEPGWWCFSPYPGLCRNFLQKTVGVG